MLSITGSRALLIVVAPVSDVVPVADSVVNAPVLGIVAPMVVLFIAPPPSCFEAIAVAIFANSTLISVPLTIFKGLPDASASLVAKFVVCV